MSTTNRQFLSGLRSSILRGAAVTALLFVTVFSACAQLTASGAFASAPNSIFPLLDRNTRLDMIDFFNSGSSSPSRNALYGSSRILSLSPEKMEIEMTSASKAEIMILNAGNDSVIALVSTVMTPTPDSKVNFYLSDWATDITGKMFAAPQLDDWLTEAGRKNRDMVEAMVPFVLASYSFDPQTGNLVLTSHVEEFLTPEVYAEVDDYMLKSLTYRLSGGKYVKSQK